MNRYRSICEEHFQKGDNLNTNQTHPLLNLHERVQILGHVHIICITVVHNRIICCQIFGDLLINSAFERIFNVMQLSLVKLSVILSKNIESKNSTIFTFHITLSIRFDLI
jgi:hypothetical protein